MTNSKQLAKLIGPTLMVMVTSEVLNAHIWVNVPPIQTYLAGTLWFVAGLAILRSHNYWTLKWSLFVTIIGWFSLIGGLSRMLFPEAIQRETQNNILLPVFQILLFGTGIILSYKGFIQDRIKTSKHQKK